ncbi:hypothetical protein [Saccharopolyspora hattusasensis]|uniref:hypothetical protein n=1 Tax=Saccharopolyspora hattusasensis TaxID=1128679 RepID=UPI003D974F7A
MLQEVPAGETSVLSNETTTVSYAPVTGASHTIQVLAIDGPDPLELLRAELAGWSVLTAPADGEALRRAGARLKRHAHAMRRDLRSEALRGSVMCSAARPPSSPGWAACCCGAPWRG